MFGFQLDPCARLKIAGLHKSFTQLLDLIEMLTLEIHAIFYIHVVAARIVGRSINRT